MLLPSQVRLLRWRGRRALRRGSSVRLLPPMLLWPSRARLLPPRALLPPLLLLLPSGAELLPSRVLLLRSPRP